MLKMWWSSQLKKNHPEFDWLFFFFFAQSDIGGNCFIHIWFLTAGQWTITHFSCLGLTTFLLSIYQEPMQLDITEVEHCLMWRLRCLTWRLQVIFHFSEVLTTFFLSGLNTDFFFPQNGNMDTGGRNENVEGKNISLVYLIFHCCFK